MYLERWSISATQSGTEGAIAGKSFMTLVLVSQMTDKIDKKAKITAFWAVESKKGQKKKGELEFSFWFMIWKQLYFWSCQWYIKVNNSFLEYCKTKRLYFLLSDLVLRESLPNTNALNIEISQNSMLSFDFTFCAQIVPQDAQYR